MQQLWTVLSSCCITIILIFQPLIFTRGCWGKPSSSTDYDCDYHDYTLGTGKCYSCPYQESLTCFRSNVCVHYKNAVIYTVSGSDWEKSPVHGSIIIRDGVIAFLGSEEPQMKAQDHCHTIDLAGKTILPGLHDVHMHPMEVGSPVAGTCKMLPNTLPNPENKTFWAPFEQQRCYDQQKGTDWVLGHGHSIWAMLAYINQTGSLDPKDLLDKYVKDRPVVIMEETSHSVWVNSEALKRAGLTGKNPTPPIGGEIMLNDQNEANGILLENAGIWILDKAFDPILYPELEEYAVQGLEIGLESLAANGITSFVDARCYWSRGNHKAYEKLEKANKMTARAVLALWADPAATNDTAQIASLKQLYSNDNDKLVRRTAIKVYQDGIIPTRTAKLLQDYTADSPDYGIGNRGMNYFTRDRLAAYVAELQDFEQTGQGFDFLVHAIGDAATREALDAFEFNYKPDTRHRCTHIELVDPKDWPRFANLSVIADAQVAGDFALDTSLAFADMIEKVGKERGENFIPIRSLQENGSLVTLSSDWDVSELNPFVGLSNAINRGSQSVSLKSALEMYTINAAFAMRQNHLTGSLEVGKAADLIVIDTDIFEHAELIRSAKVLQTVVAGEEIYSKL